jgi:hypothetical protein
MLIIYVYINNYAAPFSLFTPAYFGARGTILVDDRSSMT